MTVNQDVLQLTSYVVSTDPKISIVPGFLSDWECDQLITLSESLGFQRSLVGRGKYAMTEEDKSSTLLNEYSENRTSSSVDLSRQNQRELMDPIEARLAGLTKLPVEHLEDLMVVKYQPGQFFGPHHDGIFRPATVFIYLNDLPESGGGETRFTNLGIRIKPRKGTAVYWRNIDEMGNEDSRLVHEALPPADGAIKYGVNCFFNQHAMR
jgi:prolyl 4-hydroxylase